tara:strand:+ start:56 stop:1861 length:1806 start_codon:yes stop_codon:yes gene_type:complete
MDSPTLAHGLAQDSFIGAVPKGDSFHRKVLKTLWVLLNLLVLIALPLAAWDMHRHDMHPHFIAWFVAGVFVLLAVPITFYEVAQHLEHYRAPRLQRHVIRILFMVPIYAVDCWLALRFKDWTIYFDTIRECYEAYVVYNFYSYCTVYLEAFCVPGLEQIVSRKPQQKHIFPISLFVGKNCAPMTSNDASNYSSSHGSPFLRLCRHGVINYVVTRPLTTLIAFIAQAIGVYGDGEFTNPWVAYPYLALINNVSQAWAMYCLILFYKALREELAPLSPFYKFLTVKAVVFLSFWQGQALLLATKLDLIDSLRGHVEGSDGGDDGSSGASDSDPSNAHNANSSGPWSDYDDASFATALQEFAICVEMFFAAIAHAYAFPVSEYDGGSRSSSGHHRSMRDNMADMFDLRDVYHDVVNFSESNKDEFWESLRFRYRAFVGIFTGTTPLKGSYQRVREESGGGMGTERTNRGTRLFHENGGGTVGELHGINENSPKFFGRELKTVTPRLGPQRTLSEDMGSEVALFASESFRGGNEGGSMRGNEGGSNQSMNHDRERNPENKNSSSFSMPGVSALPGVDNGPPGGSFSVAPLEREGRSGSSKKFSLE